MQLFLQYFYILIIPILTTSTVVIAILFDGKLVSGGSKPLIKRIKPVAYILIFITLSLNAYQAIDSDKTLKRTITQSRKKEIKDSVSISKLEVLATTNLIKTDSVKIQLIDNAVKAIEEQRKAIEREKESNFIHLRSEIFTNMSSILLNFDDTEIRSYDKTDVFVNISLKNEALKKYIEQTSNEQIIVDLTFLNEHITILNDLIQRVFTAPADQKTHNINSLLQEKNSLFKLFYRIYCITIYFKSYKEYEATNFYSKMNIIDANIIFKLFGTNLREMSKNLVYDTVKKVKIEENKKVLQINATPWILFFYVGLIIPFSKYYSFWPAYFIIRKDNK